MFIEILPAIFCNVDRIVSAEVRENPYAQNKYTMLVRASFSEDDYWVVKEFDTHTEAQSFLWKIMKKIDNLRSKE